MMNTKLKSIILTSILVSAGIAEAAPLSPEKAWQRAKDGAAKVFSFKAVSPKLEHTFSKEGHPTLYIFNVNGKTICVSAEDEVFPILGYADAQYSMTNLSPAFEAWLNAMSEEIALVREGAAPREGAATRAQDYAPIPPLCKTKWNQDAPYNNACPKKSGETQRTYTGCVATAMAQVMKYHNWPETGEGNNSYTWNGLTLKENFSSTSFDWANMLDSYSDVDYTDDEAKAVARLMRSCGISVDMSYSTQGSGALSQLIGGALGNYFKYDKSRLRYLMRDFYSLEEWEAMIYGSLQNEGPVILDGQSNQGGHSFVCDGYDKDGYFHINWGWGGVSDGYYLLSVLDPYNQGIGGSGDNSGFNYMQDAITGIAPAKGENSSTTWIGQLYSMGPFVIDTSVSYSPGDDVGPLCEDGVYNFGPAVLPAETELGLLFTNEQTEEKFCYYGVIPEPVGIMYGFSGLSLPIPEELKEGKYRVTLSYRMPEEKAEEQNPVEDDMNARDSSDKTDDTAEPRDDSEGWLDILFPYGTTSSYIATVSDGIVTFEDSTWRPSGAAEIAIAPADDTIRYYNLQGIEIKAPRKGELLIQKSGKATRKVIF